MGDTLEEIERRYCPPLDTALFHAIISDYDLSSTQAVNDACQVLDDLRASAEIEESSGFDPSGSSAIKDVSEHGGSCLSPSEGASAETDITAPFSAWTLEESPSGYDHGIDAMTDQDKSALLQEMFADMKPYDIDFALKKQKGDFGATAEVLLTQQYLAKEADEDGRIHQVPRGVDGFAVDQQAGRAKKNKARRANKNSTTIGLNDNMVEGSTSSLNRWQMARDDVQFITNRTNLSTAVISSIYNAAGHSRRAALIAICEKDPKAAFGCNTDLDDPLVQSNIVDLKSEFPSVSLTQVSRVILLTHPLMVSAREIAEVMSDAYQEPIVPQYVNTRIDTQGQQDLNRNESDFQSDVASLPVNSRFDTLRSNAFAQASAAYRKSRSNPLMGGAAAYYASIGHTANAAMKRSRAIEANSRVAAQSSSEVCDLHGVTVVDANRIAKQYVERWWEQRREWSRSGSTMGTGDFRVVVGRGSHSTSGVGKLGPAVAKMLKNEGWKVNEQVGELVVTGRIRK